MIPGTLNPEIHATKIETQYEIKRKEIKKYNSKSLTSVKICEILKQENAEEHESNAEIINVINVSQTKPAHKTAVSNVQEHGINTTVTNIYRMEKGDKTFRKAMHGYPGIKNSSIYSKDHWVQFNLAAGIPEDSSPLSYDSSRNSFIAIVFGITLVMLVITTCFVGFIYLSEDLREFFIYDGKLFLVLGMGGMLILNYAMMCSVCTRRLPCSIIVLVLAVFFMSLITAYITALYRTDIIVLALFATAITVLVCLGLAFTSFDFTKFLLYIIGISVAFSALVLIVCIVTLTTGVRYKPLHLVILAVGTILNVIILIMQLQMILGGRTVEISEDDWALAAFMLYTSIVDIFLQLVQLLGAFTDD